MKLGRVHAAPAQWLCAGSLLLLIPVAFAQNGDGASRARVVTADRLPAKTQRQQWAALKEATRLSDQAEKFEKKGKQAEAERAAEQALAIEEQVRGPWHLQVAQKLDQVADLYWLHEKESAAQPLYERARAIRERALSTHPDVYEQQDEELRVKRTQPVEKLGTGQRSSPAGSKPKP